MPNYPINPLRNAIVLVLLIACSFEASSQVPKPNYKCKDGVCLGYDSLNINLMQLYKILADWKGDDLVFKDCKIQRNESAGDFIWMVDDYTDKGNLSGYSDLIPDQLIKYSLRFDGCALEDRMNSSIVLQKFRFKKRLSINNCTGYGIEFNRCVFENGVAINDLRTRYFDITSCHFFSALVMNDVELNTSRITDSWFSADSATVDAFDGYPYTFGIVFENNNDLRHFTIQNNEFVRSVPRLAKLGSALPKAEILTFENFQSDHLFIRDCNFECTPLFRDFSASESFLFQGNSLGRRIIFEGSPNIPTAGSTISFAALEAKLGYYTDSTDSYYRFLNYIHDEDYKNLDDGRPWVKLDVEKDIIPAYSKLLEIYDATADLESYNRCFMRLKEIEEKAAKYKYIWNGRHAKDWFKWRMDQFLSYFSAYGTDPVLALIKCAQWLGIFCLIYIFFPSEEDNLGYQNIQMALHRYIDHFSLEKKNFFSADDLYKRDVVRLNEFKRSLVRNKLRLPPVISFFGQPFFRVSLWISWIEHRIRSIIKFNIYQDWAILDKKGRLKMSGYISLSLVGFLLWGLIMRIVNAVTLSLNAFVTLGYGEISAKGIARYLCVLEGVVGWFFLSLFSVALIGQILQ
jgi:hypothetical protein